MIKRLLPLTFFLFSLQLSAVSQQIDSVLNIYAENFAPEKLHLHFDRSIYSKDETVYYKAYLLADHDLSEVSKNLYVDFFDDAGKLLQQTTAPLIQSSAKGSYPVPANYTGNSIHVKAYTKWMLNFDTAFIYSHNIHIYQAAGNKITKGKSNEPAPGNTVVYLYPEGGFAIEGLNTRFAFAAVNQFGNPVDIKGKIRGSDGKMTDSAASVHDGMGSFLLLPQKGMSYSFEWKDEKGNPGTTPVTIEKTSGANLQILPQQKKAVVTIQRTTDAGELFKTMHLLVHRNYSLRYKLDINMSAKTSISLNINTDDFPSGIAQFTLFNDEWAPVAERIVFVNNKDYLFHPELTITKKDISKKGKNELEIFVADTLLANMSLSVIDAATVNESEASSIFSDFLLSDEIKGKVHNPAYYFSGEDSQLAVHADLVMLTHGHRRFDWQKIAKGELPVIQYPAETDYLLVKGKLTSKKMIRSADKLLLNVMLQGKDSTKTVFIIPGETGGIFEKKNVFFYDTVRLFYNLNDKRSIAGQNVFEFENGLLTSDARNRFFAKEIAEGHRNSQHNTSGKISNVPENIFFEEQEKIKEETTYKTLKEVVLSSKVKTKMEILDNFYTRGVFAGDGNNYKVDIEGDINARGYSSIFYYLQSKIPGLGVFPNTTGSGVIVTWIKNFSIYGEEKSEPTFFLDEVQVSLDAISSVPVADIAYVKAFRPPFVGSFLNGAAGTIALYTKKGNGPIYQDTSGTRLARTILEGYTKFKEFTQPDYDNNKSNSDTDHRATLYWNPYVLTDKSNQRVNCVFYNNDISKKLVIVLEGVNLKGKMARVVKVLE